ncbi:MAG: DUF4221 family protein [Runella sp.]
MKNNFSFFFLSLCYMLCLLSCTLDSKKEYTKHKHNFVLEKTNIIKTIFHDSVSSPIQSQFRFYSEGDKSYIYCLNKLKNVLEIYHWDTGKLLKRITLEKEGPNGVSTITAFHIVNQDSVFVLATYSHRISLIDSNGSLIRSYSLLPNGQTKEKLGNGLISYGNYRHQMVYLNGSLFAPASPFDGYEFSSFYNNGECGLRLNLQTGEVNPLMSFPKNWKQKFKEGLMLPGQRIFIPQTFNLKKQTTIISFPTENYLFEVDLNNKRVNQYLCKSQYFDEIDWINRRKNTPGEEFIFHTKNPFYENIYFDAYRNIYLRFVAYPNTKKVDEFDGRAYFKYSLIILNESFEHIAEIPLDDEIRIGFAIITSEGIYFDEYIDSEDKSMFRLYKIKMEK